VTVILSLNTKSGFAFFFANQSGPQANHHYLTYYKHFNLLCAEELSEKHQI